MGTTIRGSKSGDGNDAAEMIGMPWPQAKSSLKTAVSSKMKRDHSSLFVRGCRAPFDTIAGELSSPLELLSTFPARFFLAEL
jgi:hypothetical protein